MILREIFIATKWTSDKTKNVKLNFLQEVISNEHKGKYISATK
jgi:hypothetical protein